MFPQSSGYCYYVENVENVENAEVKAKHNFSKSLDPSEIINRYVLVAELISSNSDPFG